MWGR